MDPVFKALADPTRRRILALLGHRELAAGDIADHFPVAWASVSHHLSVLKEAKLVRATRQGRSIRYALNPAVVHGVVEHLVRLLHGESTAWPATHDRGPEREG